jgi:Tfp pilus assembly protein PilE
MKFKNNDGQNLIEFILVFVVLLIVAICALAGYKSFWKERYQKASILSSTHDGSITKVSYVK